MPTLANGSGALRINVPKGSSLIIRNQSGVETVTGSSAAREDATYALGSGAFVYGPQTASSDLSISTTGVLTYDIVAGDPTPASTPAQVARNASTGSPTGLIDPATGQPLGGGGTKTDRVKAALRVSSAAAWGNNIRANDPWFLPRAVARNTYYALNNVVLGDDGESMYICRDDGVTATTGTLTGGTNRVAITDGTARFVYAGRARSVFGTQQNVLSVNTRALGIPAGARNVRPMFANPVLVTPTCGRLHWVRNIYGGPNDFLSVRGPNGGAFGSVENPAIFESRGGFALETDSDYIVLASANEISRYNRAIVEVNERVVVNSQCHFGTDGTGAVTGGINPGVLVIDLSAWGGVGVWKRVRLHSVTDATVSFDWYINPRSQMRPWSAPAQIITTLEGDSIGATGWGYNDWLHNAMDWLGQNRSINLAVGATGFESNGGSNDKTFFYQRIPAVLAENPDLHLIGGNHNGGNTVAPADPKSFASYMSTLRADSRGADLPVLVFGTQRLQGETNATVQVWEGQLASACAAYKAASGDDNVWFVPGQTATPPWSEGNGHTLSQQGFNSDYFFDADEFGDGHPNVTFNQYWGYRVASAIRDWANT